MKEEFDKERFEEVLGKPALSPDRTPTQRTLNNATSEMTTRQIHRKRKAGTLKHTEHKREQDPINCFRRFDILGWICLQTCLPSEARLIKRDLDSYGFLDTETLAGFKHGFFRTAPPAYSQRELFPRETEVAA